MSGFNRPNFGSRSGQRFGTTFGTGLRRPFIGPRRFRRDVFFGSFTPFYFGGYGYPYDYDYYSFSEPDSYPVYDNYATNSYQNDFVTQRYDAQQNDIDRLEDEVARLRNEREARAAKPGNGAAGSTSDPATPTVLVFRDKHTREVQNYAVVGETIWIFNEQRATKLPLSALDIDATTKANDDRGVDFRLPN
jgi:hypothetical protein